MNADMNTVLPLSPAAAATPSRGEGSLRKSWAVAQVVIKELYRRKDFYVLFILTALLSLVLGSVNFFGDDKIVRYLKEICLLFIWVASLVIAITTTARQIPAERENRTLFPLLAKPLSRNQLLFGKFLGCWLAVGISLVCFYLFFGVLCSVKEQSWPVFSYLEAMVLHWFMLGVVVSMTLLGSVVFAAPSSNGTIILVVTTGILFVGRHLGKVAMGLPEPSGSIVYGVYFAIPHLEFFDIREHLIHNWELIPLPILAGALAYAAAYGALFLALACWRFRRQSVN
jgi:ABC-type transport system involved in multi-copper enzyme maturation permease subunit